jgi:hypothetical protein
LFSSKDENAQICKIKNLKKNKYIKLGLYIISSCIPLIQELAKYNIKKKSITSITKLAIYKIIKDRQYNAYDFLEQFFKTNENYEEDKEYSSQEFIITLINNINKEFLYMNFKLYDKKDFYYKPEQNERDEYNQFIEKIFPESIALYIISGIIKKNTFGKCI